MVQNIEFTQKIITPEIPDFYYSRDRLTGKLLSFRDKKLILITAPAGYGKTSLSVEFFHRLKNQEKIWISISTYDNSIENFFLLLALAFESNLKKTRFGANLKSVISRSQNLPFDEKVNNVISSFSSDLFAYLKKRNKDIYIFLDDFHNIDEGDEVCTALNYFLEFLPSNVHLVFISRRDPAKINYPKFLAKNWMGKITIEDLVFSDQDVKKFIRIKKLKTGSINKNLLEKFIKSAEGWVTAIHLLLLRNEFSAIKDADLISSRADIFEYFTYELFSQLKDEEKRLMLVLSYPEYFNKEIIEDVLEIKNGFRILFNLYQKNIFINREDENFRFHELLRGYLNKIAVETLKEEEIIELYRKLGIHYLQNREWREDYIGLNYLILAREYPHLRYWIKMNTSDKLLLIHSSGLYSKLEEITNDKFSYSLEYILLKVNTFVYKDKEIDKALHYLKNILRVRFRLRNNDSILISAAKIRKSDLDYYAEILMLICNCMFLKEGISKDNIRISEHILKFKLKSDQEIQFIVSLVKSYIATGENSKSKKYMKRLRVLFDKVVRQKNSNSPDIEENTFIESIFSMILFFDYGDYKSGNEVINYISNNIDLDKFDLSNLSQVCFALFTSYNKKAFDYFFEQLKIKNTVKNKTIFSAYKNQYEFQRILKLFLGHNYAKVITELEIMKKKTHLKNYIYFIDALILYCYNLLENPAAVLRNIQSGEYNVSSTRALILRQEAYLIKNDFENYQSTFREINKKKVTNFTLFNQAVILFYECYYCALNEMKNPFKSKFTEFVSLSKKFGYEDYIAFRAGSNSLRYVFTYALRYSICEDYLKKVIPDRINQLMPEQKSEFSISVKFFDKNKIFINGKELKDTAWLRPRSKSIFLYIAYRTKFNLPVTKETIIDDLLFSSKKVNYEAIADVEINNVRKALQNYFSEEFQFDKGKDLITLRKKKYFLSSGSCRIYLDFDVDELLKLSSEADSNNHGRLTELYKNDFAEGIYHNWAEDLRVNYRFVYMNSVNRIIRKMDQNGGKLKVFLEKLCETRNSDEEMLSLLLKILMKEKDKRKFIHVFRSYQKRLMEDLSIPPADEFEKYYSEISA
ncbi:MAG: AAA family ATPase [Bacteroidetes bacterium]|nr:AAA family ATPase [Bacteroidota bacterium]